MSNSEAVKQWRRTTKNRIITSMGGCCQACGYSKCQDSLELHHIDPTEKEFGIGAIRANPISWDKIVTELRKCILLCANCHREVHANITAIPENYNSFNEEFADYKEIKKAQSIDQCPCCGKDKPKKNKYCSLACAGKNKGKVDWASIDLETLLKTHSYEHIGRMYGVTGASVKKQAIKRKDWLHDLGSNQGHTD